MINIYTYTNYNLIGINILIKFREKYTTQNCNR